MRNWGMWRALARYFPAELVKTAELDPQYSYIFALHPHGILTCNSWMNFSSEATGFSKLFPGIEMHTGKQHYYTTVTAKSQQAVNTAASISTLLLQ